MSPRLQPAPSWFANALGTPCGPLASGENPLHTHDGFCRKPCKISHQVGCVEIINSLLFIPIMICTVCIFQKFTFWGGFGIEDEHRRTSLLGPKLQRNQNLVQAAGFRGCTLEARL